MEKYEVGQVIEKYKNHADEPFIEMDDSGITILVLFNSPSQSEIEQFKSEHRFEIRFTVLDGIIVFTLKIGNLNWMDVPYTPHLSPQLTKHEFPIDENKGLNITLFLIDSSTGEIKHIRLLGLSNKFTKKLIGEVMEQKMQPFNKDEYFASIAKLFAKYNTKQIVKLSDTYCTFN